MNSAFIYHTSCLLRSTKDEKGGKQMAKQINYKKKNHITCQIYTLLYVAVFFPPPAHIVEIEFWRTYTLLTPFMLDQLIEFFFSHLSPLFCQHKIKYIVCLCHPCSFYIYISDTWNPKESPFKLILGDGGVEKKWHINTSVQATQRQKRNKHKKRTPWGGLKRLGRQHQCGLVGKKIHMKSFHIRSD